MKTFWRVTHKESKGVKECVRVCECIPFVRSLDRVTVSFSWNQRWIVSSKMTLFLQKVVSYHFFWFDSRRSQDSFFRSCYMSYRFCGESYFIELQVFSKTFVNASSNALLGKSKMFPKLYRTNCKVYLTRWICVTVFMLLIFRDIFTGSALDESCAKSAFVVTCELRCADEVFC